MISVLLAAPAVGLGCLLAYQASNGNLRAVAPAKVYRSGQPTANQFKKWTERFGFRTVINLRGSNSQVVADEEAMAGELGLKMITFDLSAHRLPAKGVLLGLVEALETAEQPVLIHCQSGIDRAGTASALAAMVIGQTPYDMAKWQAYVAPGPWKRMTFRNRKYYRDYSHISDLLCHYERFCKQHDLDINDLRQLKKWIASTDALPEVELE